MIPYILLIAVPPIVSYVLFSASSKRDKMPKAASFIFFAIFILLLSLRDTSVGVDTDAYKGFFNRVGNIDWVNLEDLYGMEYGFLVFMKIVNGVFGDFRAFIVIVALISVCPLLYFYVKENKSVILTISLFLVAAPFTMYFSGLRQIIAMAFAIPLYYLARKKKLIWFILLVILATQFHASAVALIALYPLLNIKITEKGLFFSLPLIGLVFVFNKPIFEFLLGFMDEKYEKYIDNEASGAFMMIILFILFVVFSFIITDEKALSIDDIRMRNLLVICMIIQFFAPVNDIAMRINYYYMPFVPVAVSRMVAVAKPKYKQVAKLATVVMSTFFIIYYIIKAQTGEDILEIYPYKFFWES